MAKAALTQLQDQIEAVRREAYAAGYAAALQSVREFASRSASGVTEAATPARGRLRRTQPAPAPRRRGRQRAVRTGGSATPRPPRGTNARLVEEVLRSFAPRAARPAEIRSALQSEKGVALPFTSIRHALDQLEARQAVEQLDGGKTWRYRGEAATGLSG